MVGWGLAQGGSGQAWGQGVLRGGGAGVLNFLSVADGVVVVPQAVEAEAIQRAWEKVHSENVVRDAIRRGMKAVDAFEKYGVL